MSILVRRRRLLAAFALAGLAPAARALAQVNQTCTGMAGTTEDTLGSAPGSQVELARENGKVVPTSGSYSTAAVTPTLTAAGRGYQMPNAGKTGRTPGGVGLIVLYQMGLDAADKITSQIHSARIIMPGLVKAGQTDLVKTTVTVTADGKTLSAEPQTLAQNKAYALDILGSPPASPQVGQVGVTTENGPAFSKAFGGTAPLTVKLFAKEGGAELYRATVRAAETDAQFALIQQALDDSGRRMSAPSDAQCKVTGGVPAQNGYYDYDPYFDEDCFLTTAAVHTIGLADDCWELRTLRAFRDGPLTAMAGGSAVRADYYLRAPRIVAAIGARPDAARMWLRTYWTGIVPCALAAKAGANRLALAMYRRMTERLERLAA